MAQVHNALTRGQLSNALKGVLGSTKSEGGLERYSETLQAVLNLWDRPEWAFLRGERIWANTRQQVAVVAELSYIVIANPINSNFVSVITHVDGRSSTAGSFAFGQLLYTNWTASTARATLALAGNNIRSTDTRAVNTGVVVTEVWSGSDPANLGGPALDFLNFVVANEWVPFLMAPVVLQPDSAFLVITQAVNTPIEIRARGYERLLQGGELVP